MKQRPSYSKLGRAFLKSAFLAKCAIVATAVAQVPTVVDTPPASKIPNEAEACEQALIKIHSSGLAERLQKIVWDDQNVDRVIADMKRSGQIANPKDQALLEAQLRVGVLFARQGLLHEAIYQVFERRYKSKDGIANAIRAFGQISTAKAQSDLIAEIIERVLQYIPDVDGNNLDKINRTAKFINMSESGMVDFRARWILYNNEDQFAAMLQGGILSVLTSATPQLIEDVNSRGGLFRRWLGARGTIEIPDRPFVTNDELAERQVEVENRRYYDDASYLTYLRESSSAARRFFVLDRLAFLTREQIAIVLENKESWWLKPGVITALKNEDLRREILNRKFTTLDGLRRDLDAAERTLKRKMAGEFFDSIATGTRYGPLRQITDPAQWRKEALDILDGIYEAAPARDFVGVMFNVLEASLPIHGNHRESMGFIEAAVGFVNVIGLTEDQAGAVRRNLGNLAGHLTGPSLDAARARINDVKVAPTYTQMTADRLKELIPPLAASVREASEDLDRTYAGK